MRHFRIINIVILFFYFSLQNRIINAQSADYLVHIKRIFQYNSCGSCSAWTYRDFRLGTDVNTEIEDMDVPVSGGCTWTGGTANHAFVMSTTQNFSMYFWDGIKDGNRGVTERGSSTVVVMHPTDEGTVIADGHYESEDPGMFSWHSNHLDVVVTMYQIPKVKFDNPNFCISTKGADEIKLLLNHTGYKLAPNAKYYIDVASESLKKFYWTGFPFYETKPDMNRIELTSNMVNSASSALNLSWNDLTGAYSSAWWGKKLYIRVIADFNQFNSCYNSTFPCDFNYTCSPGDWYGSSPGTGYIIDNSINANVYLTIPSPTSYQIKRTACSEDTIILTFNASEISNVSNYKFRMRKSSLTEGDQNIIKLKYLPEQTIGNQIKLIRDLSVTVNPPFDNAGGTYIMQVFDGAQDQTTPTADLHCAANIDNISISAKPTSLSLTQSSLSTYTFTYNDNGTSTTQTYNITRKGANDGWVDLTVDVPSRVASWEVSENGGAYTSFSTSKTATVRYSNMKPNTTYLFKIADTDGCPSAGTITVSNLIEPQNIVPSVSSIPVTCHANNSIFDASNKHGDGALAISWTGGIGGYTVKLLDSNGAEMKPSNSEQRYQSQFQDLPEADYIIRVTDSQNVQKDTTVTIGSNAELKLSRTKKNVDCFFNAVGWVNLTVENGVGNLLYKFTGFDDRTLPDLSNLYEGLPAGDYQASVTNTNQCTDTIHVNISEPDSLYILYSTQKVGAYGSATGYIDATILGGTAPYNYTLEKISPETQIVYQDQTYLKPELENLFAGTYKLSVTDANSCPKLADNIAILQPQWPLTLTFTVHEVTCNGEPNASVDVNATGGWGYYQFGFNNSVLGSDTIINNLNATAGTVPDTVFVLDSMNIRVSQPIVINQPTKIIPVIEAFSNLSCFEDYTGAIKLGIKGGIGPYKISTNEENWLDTDSLNGLPAGNNTIYIRDSYDCMVSIDKVLQEPDKLEAEPDVYTNAICHQKTGSISLGIKGGTKPYQSYSWYSLDSLKEVSTNSNLAQAYSGRYSFTVKDKNGCEDNIPELLISDKDGPQITRYAVTPVTCYGKTDGGFQIDELKGGTPSYTLFLNNTPFDKYQTNLEVGEYVVKISDTYQCLGFDTIVVTGPEYPMFISITENSPKCYNSSDGSITLDVFGENGEPYYYRWNTLDITSKLSYAKAGTYNVTVTDKNNCSGSEEIILEAPEAPSTGWPQNDALLCTGNALNLDGGDYPEHIWTSDNGFKSTSRYVSLMQSGIYYVGIKDANGCASTDTMRVEVSDHPLDAIILLSDSAKINENITAIDVTWPVPDSIQWFFNPEVQLNEANEWSQNFSAEKPGLITITLRAWLGGCFSDSSKTVWVKNEESGELEKSMLNEPLILGFGIHPNPNTGNFTVDIVLSRIAAIKLTLIEPIKQSPADTKELEGLKSYSVPYSMPGLVSGIYLLYLQVENEKQTVKLIIGR